MRFTVTATNPKTGLVEVVDINAADATTAAWIVAAGGAVVQRVDVAPEQHADEWESVRQEARQLILWARGFAGLLGGLFALAGAGLAIFLAPFQLSAGLLAVGITIGPAVALLLLARQASRLGQGAIVSLMTLAGLMTTGVAFIAVLFPKGPSSLCSRSRHLRERASFTIVPAP